MLHATYYLCKTCVMDDFTIDSLHAVEKEMISEIQKILKAVNVSSTAEINEHVLLKLSKHPLANTVLRLVKLLEKNMNICKSAAGKIDHLKSEQIVNQKQLLEIQQEKMGSVQQTVKTELKSWTNILKDNNQKNQITIRSVKEAVKSVNEEEKRARNFRFGYPDMYSASVQPELGPVVDTWKRLRRRLPTTPTAQSQRLRTMWEPSRLSTPQYE